MPASCRTFSSRWIERARSLIFALRSRVRSRSRRISGGGTKLGRTSPCWTSWQIHSESLTSVLRPGTLRKWCALSSQHSKRSSSACKTVFQYAGRFHPDQRDPELRQPGAERRQPGERRAERLGLLTPSAPGRRGAHGRDEVVAVHVKTSAPLHDDVHRCCPLQTAGSVSPGGDLPRMSLACALEAAIN